MLLASTTLPMLANAAQTNSDDSVKAAVRGGETIEVNAPAHTLNAADREAFRQDDEGLHVIDMPDGSQMIDLQGRFQMTSTAAVDANGDVHTNCTTAHDLAEHGIAVPEPKKTLDER
jgi:hypothetical protein